MSARADDGERAGTPRPLPPVPPPARRPAGGSSAGRPPNRDGGRPLPPPPYPMGVPAEPVAEPAAGDGAAAPQAVAPPAVAPLPPHPSAVRPASGPMRAVPAEERAHRDERRMPLPPPQPLSAAPSLLPPVPPPAPRRSLPPVPPPRRRFVPTPEDTQLIPVLPAVPRPALEDEEVELREGPPGASGGILRAAGAMAVATLVSRITGLVRTIVLAAALGVGLVQDAYNTSNTLPNIVYELLLGGVLSSVVVPLLVKAQEKDRDGGVAYAQRLATVALVGLTAVTVLAVLVAPLLTWAYGIRDDPSQVELANWLARLLLIEIVFYGLGALATAILNSRDVYGPPAWAPVLNNVVVIATGVLFMAANGAGGLTPVTISDWQIWLLGIGTTLGIAAQAVILVPLLRRSGVPLRPRWDLRQTGLREAGRLGLWVVAYAAISQVGVLVATNVANAAGRHHTLGSGAFAIASLLFQMPYGIIGVALLTALLPRMSRAALRDDTEGVVRDLSLGTRLSALGLLPVTAALIVLGPSLAVVGFAHGETTVDDAQGIGQALALGAFGLLPMAVTLLQLRVFYAMRDARTPTLIQAGMVAVRVPLLLLVPVFLPAHLVVAGLMVVTSLTYVAGWGIGEVLLRRRMGSLGTAQTLAPVLRVGLVSLAAGVTGAVVVHVVGGIAGSSRTGSLVTLLVGTVVIGVAALAGITVARVPELREPLASVRARFGRG